MEGDATARMTNDMVLGRTDTLQGQYAAVVQPVGFMGRISR